MDTLKLIRKSPIKDSYTSFLRPYLRILKHSRPISLESFTKANKEVKEQTTEAQQKIPS